MNNSMILITSDYQNKPTFELIPFGNDSCYIKGILEPDKKFLVLVSREKKEEFHFLPRLNGDGDPEMKSKSAVKDNPNPYKQQRVAMNLNLEYFIADRKEIEDFIDMVCVNSDKFDYKKYFETPELVDTTNQDPVMEVVKEEALEEEKEG